jgi:hypothetical protein
MLRGLPVHDSDRLVAVSTVESPDWESWPYAAFTFWRDSSRGCSMQQPPRMYASTTPGLPEPTIRAKSESRWRPVTTSR